MRLFVLCLLAASLACINVGCTTSRTVTITTKPPGAAIDVDGIRQKGNPVTLALSWESDTDIHYVTANLAGYKEQTYPLKSDYDRNVLELNLKPQTKKLNIVVKPAPAIISINGTPVSSERLPAYTTKDLEFTKDPRTAAWTTYTITAEREGFKAASVQASWPDSNPVYELAMKPMEKEIAVTTTPPGASVFFDDDPIGTSPTEKVTRQFEWDTKSESYFPHKIRAVLSGYPERTIDVGWDDGRTDYHVDLLPNTKTVKIRTNPPGGVVTLDGKQYTPDGNGDTTIQLSFPPQPGTNELRTFVGEIRKAKTGDTEWIPEPISIAWDKQTEYLVRLREVLTTKMPLLSVAVTNEGSGWKPSLSSEITIAAKDTAEPSGLELTRLTPPKAKGQNIDGLAISPNGRQLLFSLLVEKPELHSFIYTMNADGSAAPEQVNDGKWLDITPSFSPDAERILFSSDRGSRLIVCAMSAIGGRRVEQYTDGNTTDLYPSMDSSPKTRIFYEARSDRLPKPTIYSRPVDMISRTDLGVEGGMKPRINAQNDSVLFEAYNDQKRDIYRVSDSGGTAVNLTNSPDSDDYDASWDRLARVAFVSDRAIDEDKNHNADIWVLDPAQPNTPPRRITTNASYDDHPVWDPSGKAIYFRSNRGGEWGIWKIAVK